jgi:glycosyltransferase involved in cell wall biosynthesis
MRQVVTLKSMKLSIAIPTHNGSRYLDETFASILRQSRLPDELIISDDASDDGTVADAGRFAQIAPFSVRVVAHTPSGITANYLHALAQSTGDIIVFADQDDVWLPEKLAVIEQAFQASPHIAIVSTDSKIVDDQLRPSGKTLRGDASKSARLASQVNAGADVEHVIRGLPLLAHTLAIRSECRTSILNKPLIPAEWWFESWVSSVALSIGRLALVPEAVTLYRQHTMQVAGAPKASLRPRATVANYLDAAARFGYVAGLMRDPALPTLLSADERAQRLHLLESYLAFLEHRCRVLSMSHARRLGAIASFKTLADYLRFTSGAKSIARDCLRARESERSVAVTP